MEFMPVLPMLPSQTNNPDHFCGIERLRQHVVCAEIQGFGPQSFVCQPRSHDQQWGFRKKRDVFQHLSPRTRKHITFAKYDWSWSSRKTENDEASVVLAVRVHVEFVYRVQSDSWKMRSRKTQSSSLGLTARTLAFLVR